MPEQSDRPAPRAIAIYASPKCRSDHQRRMYKGYFNVAWFVRAYSAILSEYDRVLTTDETLEAIAQSSPNDFPEFMQNWLVPTAHTVQFESVGHGFDAQIALAAEVVKGNVERVLMFQDPDDVHEHLPEAYAFIRNCCIANIGLNINAGATFWAEVKWQQRFPKGDGAARVTAGFGPWREQGHAQRLLHAKLNPPPRTSRPRHTLKGMEYAGQTVAFVAHDGKKYELCKFVGEYHDQFRDGGKFSLTGTETTCDTIDKYLQNTLLAAPRQRKASQKLSLDDDLWQRKLKLSAGDVADILARQKNPSTKVGPLAYAKGKASGPRGGDVLLAEQIIFEWPLDGKKSVRHEGLTHAVVFFIDHMEAHVHEADIQVLLRTCLHPARGVHLILNSKTASEWGEALRRKIL